jgi:hypothetical protein
MLALWEYFWPTTDWHPVTVIQNPPTYPRVRWINGGFPYFWRM